MKQSKNENLQLQLSLRDGEDAFFLLMLVPFLHHETQSLLQLPQLNHHLEKETIYEGFRKLRKIDEGTLDEARGDSRAASEK